MRRRLAALIAALLMVAAGMAINDVGSTDELGTGSASGPAAGAVDLALLQPQDLIPIAYTSSLSATCEDGPAPGQGTHVLTWTFTAADVGAPSGVSITSATSAEVSTSVSAGVVVATSAETGGDCSSNPARDFTGTVTGSTSNGDTYTMTLTGAP